MAEITAGADFPLTPTEAFVLGGAFLIHDLGMGLAAYPEGVAALHRDKAWSDAVAALLRRKLDRVPTPEEIAFPPPDIEKEAIGETLRNLHARHAAHLALISWHDPTSRTAYHLIESPELRELFGATIGRIAYSHWWSVPALREKFSATLGAPTWCPKEWTVDALKLACVLRVADASHIDARRAPGFLRALRKPRGIGDEHWKFQQKLHQPQQRDHRLIYTTGSPFRLNDAPAWWLCLDTLKMIDGELRHVDTLLADTGRRRLQARGVAGVDDPLRLTDYIPTEGWVPVDTRVRVSDVPSLVERLGGEQLYGNDPTVPLRELIQNASDAVRARRLLEDRSKDWGEIVVRLGSDATGPWLEVEDSGLGMSIHVLTGPLLDFGTSYWESALMRQESPGLLAKGFNPTGRFGIGFFSVFMWGSHVRVTTRRPEEAQKDTRVLEFSTGLLTRPILRPAEEEERLKDGGTKVRVWLKTDPAASGGLLEKWGERLWSLERLCAWLCPALDVHLIVEGDEHKRTRVVAASDWVTLPADELIERLYEPGVDDANSAKFRANLTFYAANLRLLRNSSNEIVGRVAVFFSRPGALLGDSHAGAVTIGGLRATELNLIGVLTGRPVTAARSVAIPIVENSTIAQWASDQARLIALNHPQKDEDLYHLTHVVYTCGGDAANLPIGRGRDGWLTAEDIALWTDVHEVLLVDTMIGMSVHDVTKVRLDANVIATTSSDVVVLMGDAYRPKSWPDWHASTAQDDWLFRFQTPEGAVIKALARAWSTSVKAILDVSQLGDDALRKKGTRRVGTLKGKVVAEIVKVIRNPANCHEPSSQRGHQNKPNKIARVR
jgi:hypothetical protein